jgi:hypothetical protein
MTRDEFIAGYCERSGVTWEWLSQRRTAIPCDCGEPECEGWQMGYIEDEPQEPLK